MSHGTSPQADLLLDRCSSSPRLTPASAERRCCPYPSLAFVSHHRFSQKISKDYKRTHAIPCHPIPSKLLLYRIKPPGFKYVSHGTSPQADHVLERSSSCPPRLSPSSAERRCCPYSSLASASHERFTQKISKEFKRLQKNPYHPIPSKLLLYRIKPPGFKYVSHGTSPQADLLLDRCSSSPRLTPASAERRCCSYSSLASVSHERFTQKITKDIKRLQKNPCHPIPSKLLLYRIKPPGFKYVSHGTSPQADLLLDRCSSSPRLTPASAERRCCPYSSLASASHERFTQKISKDYKRTHAIQYLPNFSSIESSPLG